MHEMFEPPLCRCGHYAFIHKGGRCPGWSRRKLRLGPVLFTWRCWCRRPVSSQA